MDEPQLIEWLNDFDDVEAIKRLLDATYKFLEDYCPPEFKDAVSADADALDLDNARRFRESQSDNQKGFY